MVNHPNRPPKWAEIKEEPTAEVFGRFGDMMKPETIVAMLDYYCTADQVSQIYQILDARKAQGEEVAELFEERVKRRC